MLVPVKFLYSMATYYNVGKMTEPTKDEIYVSSPILIGQSYRFAYPEGFKTLPDYTAHSGHIVTVLRACTEEEADILWDDLGDGKGERVVDLMFKVRAADGWEGDAWESELEPAAEEKVA